MLKRYWVVVHSNSVVSLQNFGVSAFSAQQAKSLIKQAIENMRWTHISAEDIDTTEIIENIDVNTLDENHVIPNMGVVSRLGVWYPNCNSL